MSFFSWLFSLFHHHHSKPVSPTPLFDAMSYLAQHGLTDTLTIRRCDFGNYQIEDTFKTSDSSAVTAWSYPPFGAYVPGSRDGGEEYVINGDTAGGPATVSIGVTLDPSHPTEQDFGTGWIAFKTDADAAWKSVRSFIGLSPVYTRYRRSLEDLPVIGTVDCIVSEHYSGLDVASAQSMERFFFAKGYGRVCWQAWTRSGSQVPEFDRRAPDFGWNQLDGFVLADERCCVNPIPTVPITGDQLWTPGK